MHTATEEPFLPLQPLRESAPVQASPMLKTRLPAIVLQVSEERLIELLEQVNQQAGGGRTRVTIQRRRTGMDDDDY